jgi:hypothetical protein
LKEFSGELPRTGHDRDFSEKQSDAPQPTWPGLHCEGFRPVLLFVPRDTFRAICVDHEKMILCAAWHAHLRFLPPSPPLAYLFFFSRGAFETALD